MLDFSLKSKNGYGEFSFDTVNLFNTARRNSVVSRCDTHVNTFLYRVYTVKRIDRYNLSLVFRLSVPY